MYWLHSIFYLDISLLLPPAAVVLGLGGGVVAGLVLGPGLVGVLAQAVIQLQADTVLYLLRYIYNISTISSVLRRLVQAAVKVSGQRNVWSE